MSPPFSLLSDRGKIETCCGCGRLFYPFGPPLTEAEKDAMKEGAGALKHISISPGRLIIPTPRELAVLIRCGECMKIWDEGQRLEEARRVAEKVKQEKEQDILSLRIGLGMTVLILLWQFLRRN